MNYNVRYSVQALDAGSRRYLFVISHQRSFSSLFCHILGSHPQIDGYAESHISYTGRTDLRRLERMVRTMIDGPVAGRYLLDKLVDAAQYLSPDVLARPEVVTLFLARNARDTIRSIANMALATGRDHPLSRPEVVLSYYTARLEQMEAYSRQRRGDTLFIESERLLDDTEAVLERLSRWLDLREPLSANYQTFKHTGAKGYGDPSANIRAGRLVKNADERHRTYVPTAIPEEIMLRGEAAYIRCRDALLQWSSPA